MKAYKKPDLNSEKRCAWPKTSLMIGYHDKEWGVPVHDEKILFEFLILEGAQAGLTWQTILSKRENYRKAFSRFDPLVLSRYTEADVKRLLANSGIVRNRLKIQAAVVNAQRFLEVQEEFGSFDNYIRQFAGSTICYAFMQAVGMVNDHVTGCFRYHWV